MNISLSVTCFRHMFQLLSIYSEKSRSEGIASKVRWNISDNIYIIGYQSPKFQTRLSVIRLDNRQHLEIDKDFPDFLTEVPTTKGLGTAVEGNDLMIETEPEQDDLMIHSADLKYTIRKGLGVQDMELRQHYLPMEQLKIRGSVRATKLQTYFDIAPGGPLKLEISDESVQFTTNTLDHKASLDITDDVIIRSQNKEVEYLYDLYLISEAVKKLPSKGPLELFANDDLIGFRYELGENLGHMTHYQRAK